jgi:hypothetical protein
LAGAYRAFMREFKDNKGEAMKIGVFVLAAGLVLPAAAAVAGQSSLAGDELRKAISGKTVYLNISGSEPISLAPISPKLFSTAPISLALGWRAPIPRVQGCLKRATSPRHKSMRLWKISSPSCRRI